MLDESTNQDSNQPASQPVTPETSVNAAVPPVTPAAPAGPAGQPPKTRRRNIWLVILAILLLVAAAGVAGYLLKHRSGQAATAKKDIPYLTFGILNTGDLTPMYPTETADTGYTQIIDTQLYEGLVGYQNQVDIKPLLATSWSNPDDSTWVFNLRHGVKFHSGRTMTASDVKYSLDYAVAHQNDYSNATDLILASTIKQVDVVNPYQVKITTNGPDPVLLNRLTFLYIVDSKAKLGDSNSGTGPYIVKPGSANPNATTLDLEAFGDYWGGHVYTRAVHIKEEASFDKLASDAANGQLDLSGEYSATLLSKIQRAQPKYYQPIGVTDLGVNYVELNTEKTGSPLHSLAARQAVAYALNIPAIIKAGGINGTQVSQLIPKTVPGYDPSIHNIPYNPAKARQLLASVPDASAPLTLLYPSGDDSLVGEIAKELNAVGFNVKVSALDLTTLLNNLTAGQGDMFYLGYSSNTLDGLDIINNTVAGTQNYSSPTLDSLSSQASSTINPTSRIATLQKIERLVASDVPTIALYTETRTYALTKPYVINVNLPGVDTGTYFWQVYQK